MVFPENSFMTGEIWHLKQAAEENTNNQKEKSLKPKDGEPDSVPKLRLMQPWDKLSIFNSVYVSYTTLIIIRISVLSYKW